MISHIDTVSTIIDGNSGIFVTHDTLRNDFESRVFLDVRNCVPTDFIVLVVLDVLGETRALGVRNQRRRLILALVLSKVGEV